jgi:hypothetical protein
VDTGEIVPWEMWPRLVAGHVSSSAAEVKDTWSYTTTTSACREKVIYPRTDLFKPFLEVERKYYLVILSPVINENDAEIRYNAHDNAQYADYKPTSVGSPLNTAAWAWSNPNKLGYWIRR